jgi:triacylglycerol lipase
LVLEPSGQLGAIMATGTRIMYRSTIPGTRWRYGNLIFEPYNDWPGEAAAAIVYVSTWAGRPGAVA